MRYVPVILFLLLLAAPFALQRALLPKEIEPAKGASLSRRLVIITPQNGDIRNEFARAFSAWHRQRYGSEVDLDYRVPGGSSDVKRQLDSTYRAYRDANVNLDEAPADISVVWGGGDFFVDQELKPLGILQPMRMTPQLAQEFVASFPKPTLAGVKLYDTTVIDGKPAPQWIGICLSSFGVCYNPDSYRALGLPQPSAEHGWADLTDPRLVGQLALADPAHAGSAAVAYQMVIQHTMSMAENTYFENHPAAKTLAPAARNATPGYREALAAGWQAGMSELLKIAANGRYFTDSSTLVPMDVSRGEAAAGVAIDFYSRVTQESVGPDRMQYFAPIGATAITPDPVAILRGTRGEKLELAMHFVEFLLTREGQLLWDLKVGAPGGPVLRALRRMPIRRDIYADDRTNWADKIDPLIASAGFNQRGEWMSLFADTRPIWVAAWIDSQDQLHQAYRRILALPDSPERAALLDRLAALPITMGDVEKIKAERKRLESTHGELDAWRASQQIDWASKFREHYRTVAAAAR